MNNEVTFGNYIDFGIRYVPGWKSINGNHEFATLHLVLKGQIIGNSNETCLLDTWLYKVESILKLIITNYKNLQHKEFQNRTNSEIFELIYKSNQLEDEYKSKYNYLPVLPNRVWQKCNISIDETTDSYLLTMSSINDKIRFIWKGLSEPCPEEIIGKLDSLVITREKVVKRINECLKYVKEDRINYRVK